MCENVGRGFMSRFPPFSTVSYFSWEKKSKTGQEMVTKPAESRLIDVK